MNHQSNLMRRVDELGRIVIPNEFRKNLNIHEGDPILVNQTGNSIILTKAEPLRNLKDESTTYLNAYSSLCKRYCIICGTDYVLASGSMYVSKDTPLSHTVRTAIQEQREYHWNAENPMYLFGSSDYPIHALYPIGTSKNPLGATILINVREVSEEQLICAKFLAAILSNRMQEQLNE